MSPSFVAAFAPLFGFLQRLVFSFFFFFNDTATTEIYTLSLHDALPIYWDAERRQARNLDCFVAVPGLGAERRDTQLVELDVPFGTELVHYSVGPASAAVPGLPAGLGVLWQEHGRLPWPRLVEPAWACWCCRRRWDASRCSGP